jgi:ubiquitin C-terminal hydrolase
VSSGGEGAAATVVKKPETHTFSKDEADWGFSKLIECVKVLAPGSGFVDAEGNVTVHVEVQPAAPPAPLVDHSYDSKRATGFVGLKNQGATCYMNALLQVYYHVRALRRAVYRVPTAGDDSLSMPLQLQRVFASLQRGAAAVSTKALTRSFGWDSHQTFMQHDVQELNRVLLDKLEERMAGTGAAAGVDGTVGALFEGQLESFITCLEVAYESSRAESFYDIQLDVKGCADLVSSFRKFVEVERLVGENQYEAEGHGKQDAEKGFRFTRLPPVLTIHLKRFEYDPVRDGMVKVNDRFAFSRRLDLTEFLSSKADAAAPPPTYRLHSVLVHSGDVNGGHYYVHVSDMEGGGEDAPADSEGGSSEDEEDSDNGFGGGPKAAEEAPAEDDGADAPPKERWCRFDDDQVHVIPSREAVEDTFGGCRASARESGAFGAAFKRQRHHQNISNAYMLVYVREADLGAVFRPSKQNALKLKPKGKAAEGGEGGATAGAAAAASGGGEGEGEGEGEVCEAEANDDDDDDDDDDDVATGADLDAASAVPEGLIRRFDEIDARQRAQRQAKLTAHLFMQMRVARLADVRRFGPLRYRGFDDFVDWDDLPALQHLKVRKDWTVRQLYAHLGGLLGGAPLRHLRLWVCVARENKTTRADLALVGELLGRTLHSAFRDHASGGEFGDDPVLFLEEYEPDDDGGGEGEAAEGGESGATAAAAAAAGAGGGGGGGGATAAAAAAAAALQGYAAPVDPVNDEALDDDIGAALQPLGHDTALVLVKFLDPAAESLDARLVTAGVALFDTRRSPAQLMPRLRAMVKPRSRAEYVAAVRGDGGGGGGGGGDGGGGAGAGGAGGGGGAAADDGEQQLLLWEMVKPGVVEMIEAREEKSLEALEIQHGDIFILQHADARIDGLPKPPAQQRALGNTPAASAKQFFKFIYDRLEVKFVEVHSPGGGDDYDDEEGLMVVLGRRHNYEQVVAALAATLGGAAAPMMLQLHSWNMTRNEPKDVLRFNDWLPAEKSNVLGNMLKCGGIPVHNSGGVHTLGFERLSMPVQDFQKMRRLQVPLLNIPIYAIRPPTPLSVESADERKPSPGGADGERGGSGGGGGGGGDDDDDDDGKEGEPPSKKARSDATPSPAPAPLAPKIIDVLVSREAGSVNMVLQQAREQLGLAPGAPMRLLEIDGHAIGRQLLPLESHQLLTDTKLMYGSYCVEVGGPLPPLPQPPPCRHRRCHRHPRRPRRRLLSPCAPPLQARPTAPLAPSVAPSILTLAARRPPLLPPRRQAVPSDEAELMAADPEMADWKPVNVCHFCSSAPSSYYNSGSNNVTEHSTPFPWFIKRGETLAEIRERLRIKYAGAAAAAAAAAAHSRRRSRLLAT